MERISLAEARVMELQCLLNQSRNYKRWWQLLRTAHTDDERSRIVELRWHQMYAEQCAMWEAKSAIAAHRGEGHFKH